MGGIQAAPPKVIGQGDVAQNMDDGTKQSFYQVHLYVYPVLYLLELLLDFVCLEQDKFDLVYMTELDPFWADDEKNAILNPEGILFGNPIAQAACAADCIAATAHLPMDTLFWCGGCLGSLYPFSGHVNETYGNVQTQSWHTQPLQTHPWQVHPWQAQPLQTHLLQTHNSQNTKRQPTSW